MHSHVVTAKLKKYTFSGLSDGSFNTVMERLPVVPDIVNHGTSISTALDRDAAHLLTPYNVPAYAWTEKTEKAQMKDVQSHLLKHFKLIGETASSGSMCTLMRGDQYPGLLSHRFPGRAAEVLRRA